MISFNTESIDTGSCNNEIFSIQFMKQNELEELLFVSGNEYLGCQIYQKDHSESISKFKLLRNLQFEDEYYDHCCLIKNKYIFAIG